MIETMCVGDLIKRARLEHGRTQAEMAQDTGLSGSTISRLERGVGTYSLKTLRTLSEYLNIPLSDLTPALLSERYSVK